MNRHSLTVAAALILALPFAAAAQHDHGKSTTPAAKESPAKKSPPARAPAEGASIKILTPTKGQTFKGDKIEISYKLTKGKRGHHVHAYIDGELMGMFQGKTGTLNGVKPGRHTLELRMVAADHQRELAAFDRVEFMVK